jgi:hypothetical protein
MSYAGTWHNYASGGGGGYSGGHGGNKFYITN